MWGRHAREVIVCILRGGVTTWYRCGCWWCCEWEMAGEEEFVYRISTAEEWKELQSNGSVYGGALDRSAGFIHLSKLDQVRPTLERFFQNTKMELYLLQVAAKKLGDGLIYEAVDGTNQFPHFYGPSRSFVPLPLSAVTKAEKLSISDAQFSCSLLN